MRERERETGVREGVRGRERGVIEKRKRETKRDRVSLNQPPLLFFFHYGKKVLIL